MKHGLSSNRLSGIAPALAPGDALRPSRSHLGSCVFPTESRRRCANATESKAVSDSSVSHAGDMDETEIERLRKEIYRTFGSSPHKKRVWLALLETHVGAPIDGYSRRRNRLRLGEMTSERIRDTARFEVD